MKLSEFPKMPYTMTEYHMFAALPKTGQKVDSVYIAERRGENWDVKFPLKNITVTMNRLIEKIKVNREPFRIHKAGKKTGHHRVEYWVEPFGRQKVNGR